MRSSFLSIFVALLVLPYAPYANAQTIAADTFTMNLSSGALGAQVVFLQRILNQDPDTRIADVGPGSPGDETGYFGSLTKTAVIRFQAKYASEVLAPAGLAYGNGYVGLYTRAKLNALSASATTPLPVGAAPTVSPNIVSATPSPTLPTPAIAPQNPNLKNLDKFLEAIDKVAAKQGTSAMAVANMKKVAIERLSTTTDIRANFLRIVQSKTHQSVQNNSAASRILATIEQTFGGFFMPGHAQAQEATVPFGGALLVVFPCDGPVFNLTIEPLPPSYATLLSYTDGSQAFLSYNIPFTEWLLGEYEPAINEECWVGDVPYPSEGMITPMTGSSPM